MLITYRSRIDE